MHTSHTIEETAMHVVTLQVCFEKKYFNRDNRQRQDQLYVLLIQDFLRGDCYRLHRTAFNACAAEARCAISADFFCQENGALFNY